jgi:hypothetical protein
MAQESAEGVFRAIADAEWGLMSSGDFEAPTGRFRAVEIPANDDERLKIQEIVFGGSNEAFGSVEPGWYFVIQPSPDVLTYDKCKNRDYALARFALARAAYVEWLES